VVLGWWGEEVDEQLVDAFGLVVMHPMRRLGQAFDTVQVGHVVVVGFGEFWAEVAITLPPDDQGGRREWAKLGFGVLGRLPHRGPVVVDHPGCCPWLGPGLDIAFDLLRCVRRVGVLQKVPEEMPVVGVDDAFGQLREGEEEEVPGLPQLARVLQTLRQSPGMGRVEDGEAVDNLGGVLSVVVVGALILAINFAPVPNKETLTIVLAAIAGG